MNIERWRWKYLYAGQLISYLEISHLNDVYVLSMKY